MPRPDLRPRIARDLPVGRLAHRYQPHHVEPQSPVCLLGAQEVAQMRGVEGAAEDPYAQAAYSLIWPEPSTTNL